MKRDRVGRWIPDRPIEHLVYWPVIAIGMVGLYFLGRLWIQFAKPWNVAFGEWIAAWF
jgi:hypothetical protein